MSHAHVTINGTVRLDEDVDGWQRRPPQFLADLAQSGARPEPYLKAVALALVDAIGNQRSITITVDTNPAGWRMLVHHPSETPCLTPQSAPSS